MNSFCATVWRGENANFYLYTSTLLLDRISQKKYLECVTYIILLIHFEKSPRSTDAQ
jgi:hypothetical protein